MTSHETEMTERMITRAFPKRKSFVGWLRQEHRRNPDRAIAAWWGPHNDPICTWLVETGRCREARLMPGDPARKDDPPLGRMDNEPCNVPAWANLFARAADRFARTSYLHEGSFFRPVKASDCLALLGEELPDPANHAP